MTGVEIFRDGYHRDFPALFGNASFCKYALSLIARLTEGCIGLVVSFLLIITADTVVELVSNIQQSITQPHTHGNMLLTQFNAQTTIY